MSRAELDLKGLRKAIAGARERLRWFGAHPVSTFETGKLLEAHQVRVRLDDLPEKYAAMLSPLALKGLRTLSLARHVPHTARRIVLLHESGHLYGGTAEHGITYDHDDWTTAAEQAADAFAAVALLPTYAIDRELELHIWMRDVEDSVAEHLLDWADGVWPAERALRVAQNRIRIRQKLGV